MTNQLDDWSDLQDDLLCLIGQRMISLQDVIRSRAVCKSWRRALLAEQQRRFPPWLILPYCTSKNNTTPLMVGCKGTQSCRCFYDVATNQFHHVEFPQGSQYRACKGSAFGWLFMMGKKTPDISLLNPLTKAEISLPPVTSFPDVMGKFRREYLLWNGYRRTDSLSRKYMEKEYTSRIAMSAEPTAEECIVMAIRCYRARSSCLAFCKPNKFGVESWTVIPNCLSRTVFFMDVVFWRNQFYAIDRLGRVFVCDLSTPHHPTLSLLLDAPRHRRIRAHNRYLVISPGAGDDDDGQLMMVTGNVQPVEMSVSNDVNVDSDDEDGWFADWTIKFRIFKLNNDTSGWDDVGNIGDGFALFLGLNSLTFLSITKHPELVPNSIYLTMKNSIEWRMGGRKLRDHDMGIYNLATHTIQPLYSAATLQKNHLLMSPLPVWFSPSVSVSPQEGNHKHTNYQKRTFAGEEEGRERDEAKKLRFV